MRTYSSTALIDIRHLIRKNKHIFIRDVLPKQKIHQCFVSENGNQQLENLS